jgi:DNA-binding transcriptional LysR family regulator
MDRFLRVQRLWNWLPAFRAVAEVCSVHKAAIEMRVSPSALSRMVKLLEEDLGAELFIRHPSGLRLTQLGAELLSVTRDAMRLIDDGLARQSSTVQRFVIATTSDRASAQLARALSVLPPERYTLELTSLPHALLVEELLQGRADVVVSDAPLSDADLLSEPVGAAGASVYGAPSHPLVMSGLIGDEHLRSQCIAVTAGDARLLEELGGAATIRCHSVEIVRMLGEDGRCLCVLPDALVARDHAARVPGLVRLRALSPTPLFVIQRHPLPGAQVPALVVGLLAALRAALG